MKNTVDELVMLNIFHFPPIIILGLLRFDFVFAYFAPEGNGRAEATDLRLPLSSEHETAENRFVVIYCYKKDVAGVFIIVMSYKVVLVENYPKYKLILIYCVSISLLWHT